MQQIQQIQAGTKINLLGGNIIFMWIYCAVNFGVNANQKKIKICCLTTFSLHLYM